MNHDVDIVLNRGPQHQGQDRTECGQDRTEEQADGRKGAGTDDKQQARHFRQDALLPAPNRRAAVVRGYDVMVACDLPKVDAWVRFPLPAPATAEPERWSCKPDAAT